MEIWEIACLIKWHIKYSGNTWNYLIQGLKKIKWEIECSPINDTIRKFIVLELAIKKIYIYIHFLKCTL